MVNRNVRRRTEGPVGTQVTRRTVARGLAWSVPAVSVVAAAPAFALTQPCVPTITLDSAQSCRCTGQATEGDYFSYFLKFCVSNNCPGTDGGTFEIISVVTNGAQKVLNFNPNNCFPAGGTPGDPTDPGTQTGTVGNCAFNNVLRYTSTDSNVNLLVTYKVNGVTYGPVLIKSPNACSTVTGAESRCDGCASDTVLPNP